MRKFLLLSCFALMVVIGAYAQGVTTSSMNGKITNPAGEGLPGTTVLAIHTPSGSQYGTTTDAEGYYRIPNMRVGGPYKITVSFVGYQGIENNGIYLTLGQSLKFNGTMKETATELSAVEVTASGTDIFDGNRNGQKTIIDQQTINSLPTVSRSIADFARFNPLANIQQNTDGFSISLAGQNNRYNTIYIDGAVNNDVYGLAGSGTNGGQTGVQPISVDAIEQFQVAVSPFDIRQSGFSGGSINAVTRSGTNNVEGSAYYFFRNENIAGKTPIDREDDPSTAADDRKKLNPFTAKTYGLRLGGPIVKDKIFFFINGEIQRDDTPEPFNFVDYTGNSDQATINQLVNKIQSYGYDPGTYTDNESYLYSNKFLFKIDWNINARHKLTVRHSYVDAENLEARNSTINALNFQNGSEYFLSKTNSTAIELKSTIGTKYSNKLVLGGTFVSDDRDILGKNFPTVSIADGSNVFINFGAEAFSTANLLEQDIITLTNDFEIYKGKHTITIGTHNEYYNVGNLFIRENFGAFNYDNVNEFLNDINTDTYIRSFSQVDNKIGDESEAIATFKGYQFGLYAQDEFQASDNLRFTFGLRFDLPVFPKSPKENPDFDEDTRPLIEAAGYDLRGARPGNFIDPQLLISPRIGFNWDVTGQRKTQVRGGVGIFTSRLPLAWPGGAYNWFGFNIGGVRITDRSVPFNPDPSQLPPIVDLDNPTPSGQIDLFASDFKLPQVFKLNLAVDHTLPMGIIASLEGIYTKTLNNIRYQDLNLAPSTQNLSGTPDTRPYYTINPRIDPTYQGIYLASNTSKGSSYNIVASLSKSFPFGLNANIGYTYGDAFSTNDGTSSQNNSQWGGYQNVMGRNFEGDAQRSNYAMGSRIIAQLSYRKEYLGFAASQISLFYNGQSGMPFTYVVGNETTAASRQLIDDGAFNNSDPVYIPRDQADVILLPRTIGDRTYTPQEQWDILNSYIESEDYLSKNRGSYAERNMSRTPFESILDFRFLQDFFLKTSSGKKNTLQLSIDIFNFSNFLNKDWGRRYIINNNNFALLDFQSFLPTTRTPQYQVNSRILSNEDPWENSIIDNGFRSSRWQMQIGLRYIFN